jgi:hypothetical protein
VSVKKAAKKFPPSSVGAVDGAEDADGARDVEGAVDVVAFVGGVVEGGLVPRPPVGAAVPGGFVEGFVGAAVPGGFVEAFVGAAVPGGFVEAFVGAAVPGGFVEGFVGAAVSGGFVGVFVGAAVPGGFVGGLVGAAVPGGFDGGLVGGLVWEFVGGLVPGGLVTGAVVGGLVPGGFVVGTPGVGGAVWGNGDLVLGLMVGSSVESAGNSLGSDVPLGVIVKLCSMGGSSCLWKIKCWTSDRDKTPCSLLRKSNWLVYEVAWSSFRVRNPGEAPLHRTQHGKVATVTTSAILEDHSSGCLIAKESRDSILACSIVNGFCQ